MTLKAKIELKEHALIDVAWVHRFTPNLRIVCSKQVNLTNLLHEPSKSNLQIGTFLEVTL